MRFYAPQMLMLILGWALIPFVVTFATRISLKQIESAFSKQMIKKLTIGFSKTKQRLRFILIWFATLFFIIALARPQLGVHDEAVPSRGLDIVFMLDVSNSMLTEDIVPSRLKKAKHIIRNFVEKFSGDRAGIVAFAGSSYPAIPLTSDYDFIKQNLEVIDEKIIKNQGTDFKKALETGIALLDRGGLSDVETDKETQSHSRVMIILSDGEDNEGEEKGVYPLLKRKGVVVYSIGIGSTKGGPIPFRDQNGQMLGYKKDRSGNMVLSKLETKALESAASKTDGKYYNASTNEGEVDEILSLVSGLDRVDGVGRRVMVYEEMFQIPLLIGIVLYLIALFLSLFKTAGKNTANILFVLAALAIQPTVVKASDYQEYKESKEGMQSYRDGDYADAIRRFGNAQAENPNELKHHMNLGDAYFKSESFDSAAREFLQVLNSKTGNEAAKGAYNLGRSFEGAKNLDAALQAYQTGLDRLKSEPEPDREVEAKIKRALEQVQQQKQQQKQNQDQDKDKENKDQNDQNKDQDKKDQKEKKYKNPKPKFKAEKIDEEQAKRILKQLGEQEKKTQKKVMQNKNEKVKDDPIEKDW